ncbi:HAD family hydrolase [Sphaerisporangium sp. TRM90804]|uniref:HAD family hydrolase n=1 Tax=Sphaerisporangium sp. TRM90804 TaxID=3031113 RepID=UPI00244AB34F|nr:HAD family hydrolase [Sphaerisporangium sp. TRM90804]MDH2427002.1 HAD family hydrolase [Sphaerisporangium sp. TRM90804]
MQRLALFDLDDTLIDLRAAFRLWAAEFADDHRLGPGAADWLTALDSQDLPHRQAFFTQVRAHFTLPAPVDDLWAAYRRRIPSLVHCPAEILDGLSSLRADGWRVGIVTNGAADNQSAKIRRTGLADVVDGWALSGAEGVRKPDAALFEIAARRCGASLDDGGWMVGDDLAKDIAGGRDAGLRTIWINHGSAGSRHNADHMVTHAPEAVELLLRSRRSQGHPL